MRSVVIKLLGIASLVLPPIILYLSYLVSLELLFDWPDFFPSDPYKWIGPKLAAPVDDLLTLTALVFPLLIGIWLMVRGFRRPSERGRWIYLALGAFNLLSLSWLIVICGFIALTLSMELYGFGPGN